jgi:hypothetical protein
MRICYDVAPSTRCLARFVDPVRQTREGIQATQEGA